MVATWACGVAILVRMIAPVATRVRHVRSQPHLTLLKVLGTLRVEMRQSVLELYLLRGRMRVGSLALRQGILGSTRKKERLYFPELAGHYFPV